jgi:L-amino acid N-acyltransferase YncA
VLGRWWWGGTGSAQIREAVGEDVAAIARIDVNPAGMRLSVRHGFRAVGIYHEQGQLDERWVDVIAMEKLSG